jgi:uncharacterized membrane protein
MPCVLIWMAWTSSGPAPVFKGLVIFPTRAALILGTSIWCLAIVAAPLFHLTPIYAVFAAICHQLPARTWHIHGEPLAACIRCTSIYYGFLAGLLVLSKPNARWFRVAVIVTAAEWLLAFAVFDSAILRALSGILLGASAAPLVRTGVEELFTKRVRTAHESM